MIFDTVIEMVSKYLMPIKDDIEREEALAGEDDIIYTCINLLEKDFCFDIIGYSPSLTYRIREIMRTVDFHGISEEMRNLFQRIGN